VAHDHAQLQLQETLYQSRNPTRRWLHCCRRDWIVATLQSLGPTQTALEVGPGSGVYLPILARLANRVIAADIEEIYLDQARRLQRQLPNLVYRHDDITDSQQPAASVDIILCSEVIEHLADSPAALRGMHRLLADDGILLLSTPQKYSPLELCAKIAFLPGIIQLVRLIYGETILETGHINLLTEKQLRRQLAQAGFQIQRTHKSGFYLPFIAEFGGSWGQRLLQYGEHKLRDSAFSGLLWTQYYVLHKA
jgi:2-polyprenyl-3-methyl-5-hydroxy-6-metoxy-1,4-benzoquinol methylase